MQENHRKTPFDIDLRINNWRDAVHWFYWNHIIEFPFDTHTIPDEVQTEENSTTAFDRNLYILNILSINIHIRSSFNCDMRIGSGGND